MMLSHRAILAGKSCNIEPKNNLPLSASHQIALDRLMQHSLLLLIPPSHMRGMAQNDPQASNALWRYS